MLGIEISTSRSRLKQKLETLAQASKREVAAAMADQAQSIVSQMKATVPVRSGRLRDSIGYTFGDAPKDAKFVAHGNRTGIAGDFLRITIFAGSFTAFWARWVEFGTKARAAGKYRDARNKRRNAGRRGHAATPAQPYFWPIWRANLNAARAAVRKAMRTAIASAGRVH